MSSSLVVRILAVGCTTDQYQRIRNGTGAARKIIACAEVDAIVEQLGDGRPVAAICLGSACSGEDAANVLRQVFERNPHTLTTCIVLEAGPRVELFEDLIGADRIFFISREAPSDEAIEALVESAIDRFHRLFGIGVDQGDETSRVSRAQEIAQRLHRIGSQTDLADLGILVADLARDLLSARRAYCLVYESREDVLWAKEREGSSYRRESAAVGLASFVQRSGTPVCLADVADDPRYDREVDDPEGDGTEHLLALPIRESGEPTRAVLLVVRDATDRAFDASDRRALEQLIEQTLPYLVPLCLESTLKKRTEDLVGAGRPKVFRPEALEDHLKTQRQGDPLKISPQWIHWSYRVLIVVLAVCFVFSMIVEVHEYAAGQAVVRMGGRAELTALVAGTVVATEVDAGEQVTVGQVLVRLHEGKELATLQSIEKQLELQLIDRLRDPASTQTAQSLLTLRAQRELALAGLEERTIRAPVDGVVTDLRVQNGQYLSPGEVVLTVAREDRASTLLILLPGEYSPLIRQGMQARLEISGFRYSYQHLEIDSVRENIVGPKEALRYLGPGGEEFFSVDAPVIMIEASLPSTHFQFQNRDYHYRDGMVGRVEIRVRSEKILLALIPALKHIIPSRP